VNDARKLLIYVGSGPGGRWFESTRPDQIPSISLQTCCAESVCLFCGHGRNAAARLSSAALAAAEFQKILRHRGLVDSGRNLQAWADPASHQKPSYCGMLHVAVTSRMRHAQNDPDRIAGDEQLLVRGDHHAQ
jgi:hypothetical protein